MLKQHCCAQCLSQEHIRQVSEVVIKMDRAVDKQCADASNGSV